MRGVMATALSMALVTSPASAERIARVVDGDTVVMATGKKARLMHFDAREMRGKCPRERDLAR